MTDNVLHWDRENILLNPHQAAARLEAATGVAFLSRKISQQLSDHKLIDLPGTKIVGFLLSVQLYEAIYRGCDILKLSLGMLDLAFNSSSLIVCRMGRSGGDGGASEEDGTPRLSLHDPDLRPGQTFLACNFPILYTRSGLSGSGGIEDGLL